MAAPPNNLFVNALILPEAEVGGQSGTTFDATAEAGEPVVFSSTEQSVWFVWTCPTTGWYKWTIPVAGHVYRGNFSGDQSKISLALIPDGALAAMTIANALTSASGDLGPGGEGFGGSGDMTLAAFLTSGNKYFIKCASVPTTGFFNSHTVDFALEWEKFTPPANDDFANAIDLGTLPATVSGDNLDATFQTGSETKNYPNSEVDRENSVWYKFTAPATGRYRLTLNDPSTLSKPIGTTQLNNQWLYLQVSSGNTLGTYQAGEVGEKFITYQSWENNPEIPLYVDLVASTVYYIRFSCPYANKHNVGGTWFNKWAWEWELTVEQITRPANDDFANAQVLSTTLPNSVTGNTRDSTEEAGEPSVPYTFEQSVWYKFTPTTTGQYRFRILKDTVLDTNHLPGNGEVVFSLNDDATVTDHSTANTQWIGPVYTADSWLNQQHAAQLYDLIASTAYYIKVNTNGGSSFENFNAESVEFELDYELVTPPSNDNFASAMAISSASGSQAFTCLGATSQHGAGEPHSFYWNGEPGVDDVGRTVWFNWTCPATGYYKFSVEADDLSQGQYDLAIYTGAAINALTRIASNWGGDHPNAVAPRMMKTTVGINATNGTVYRIQVNSWGNIGGDAALLTWSTLTTPVGDTAASAVTGVFNGRDNNFGHSANDPPPDFVTLASAHEYWWYNDGQPGKTKWYKYTATQDSRIQIRAQQYIDDASNQIFESMDDWGIIAYKGANYASLVVAEWFNPDIEVLENIVMFPNGSQSFDGVNGDYLSTQGDGVNGQDPAPIVDVAAGETLWICVFGAYDNDYNGDTTWPAEDAHAPEVSYDLFFSHVKPPNDDIKFVGSDNIYGYPDYLYDLRKDDFWGGIVFGNRFAGEIEGTTYGAGVQAGELTHGGFGPTRSVWFTGGASKAGQWKFWVEAPEDCVLSIYSFVDTNNPAILTSLDEDDDSGAGNFPECVVTTTGSVSFWIAVDSKVATNFVLKWERINDAAVIPANDNFANAIDLGTGPKVVRGTTVGASAEYFEKSSIYNSSGPADSVWYKWTSNKTGVVKIDGRCLTNNWDGWLFCDVWEGPDKDNLTIVSDGFEGGIFYGPNFPNSQNDPIQFDAVNGNVYYFRLMTEEGSSEEFELWVDTDVVYLKLIPSGVEDQRNVDFGEVRLKLTPSGTELKKSPTVDSGTVSLKFTVTSFDDMPLNDAAEIPLKLTVSGSEGIFYEPQDSGTVNLFLTPSGAELHAHLCFAGEGNPELRWYGDPYTRFDTDPLTPDYRWFSHLHKGAQYC